MARALRAAAGHIIVTDTETDADLDTIAAAARACPELVLAGSAGLAGAVAATLGYAGPPASLPGGRAWLMIVLAGFAGAASWLAYFLALRFGPATGVAAVDRLSVIFVIVLATLFLGEAFTWRLALGGAFMVAGALLIVR